MPERNRTSRFFHPKLIKQSSKVRAAKSFGQFRRQILVLRMLYVSRFPRGRTVFRKASGVQIATVSSAAEELYEGNDVTVQRVSDAGVVVLAETLKGRP
jgi:hypothetical protein